MLKDKLQQDLKTALLARDSLRTEVLKSLKSAILYEEVAQKVRDTGLSDEQILVVIGRESKKRGESASIYAKASAQDRADKELAEKAIIDTYLPAQLSDKELAAAVAEAIADAGDDAHIGKIIGAVKAKVGQSADGQRIAAAVNAKIRG